MGANDAAEQLEVAKAECVRLERELATLRAAQSEDRLLADRRRNWDGTPLRTQLEAAPGNAVVYSEKAWAVARKSSSGQGHDMWFADHGAQSRLSLTSEEMVAWTDDWVLMVPDVERDGWRVRAERAEAAIEKVRSWNTHDRHEPKFWDLHHILSSVSLSGTEQTDPEPDVYRACGREWIESWLRYNCARPLGHAGDHTDALGRHSFDSEQTGAGRG